MAGFGSLVPGMAPMPIPQMKSGGMGVSGMALLKAALGAAGGAGGAGAGAGGLGALLGGGGAAGGGAGAGPAVGESAGPGMPMQVAPPPPAMAAAGSPQATGLLGLPRTGMLGALMAKMQPPMSPASGPIDPNTGMPVTADVLAGAADMGGPGPGPNAITGMW